MKKLISRAAALSLLLACLLTFWGCGQPEYPATATPQQVPVTPGPRDGSTAYAANYGSAGYATDSYAYGAAGANGSAGFSSGANFAAWPPQEREAAHFIQSAPIYFYYDSFALTASAKAVLDQKAERLKAFPQFRVRIGGHCDERGSEAYNYGLGSKRANAARNYLIQRGVSPAQLEAVSYGKANPLAGGKGESVWSQNRRADFAVGRR